jgi:uncharacterized protein (TIGR03437 family)
VGQVANLRRVANPPLEPSPPLAKSLSRVSICVHLCSSVALFLYAFPPAAQAQPPSYTAADFVNASDYAPGPFAPNSVISLFGSNLSFNTATGAIPYPVLLGGCQVWVSNTAAPLLYVSSSQINFLIPGELIGGTVSVQVERQGVIGPSVSLTLVDSAPAPFIAAQNLALAEDWNQNYALLNSTNAAYPGDTVVLYLTGLGHTLPNPDPGTALPSAATIANPSALSILLNGTAIDPALVLYAGSTPNFPGLYQINFMLPVSTPSNPSIAIAMGSQTSPSGILLPVQPLPPLQLDSLPPRKH